MCVYVIDKTSQLKNSIIVNPTRNGEGPGAQPCPEESNAIEQGEIRAKLPIINRRRRFSELARQTRLRIALRRNHVGGLIQDEASSNYTNPRSEITLVATRIVNEYSSNNLNKFFN